MGQSMIQTLLTLKQLHSTRLQLQTRNMTRGTLNAARTDRLPCMSGYVYAVKFCELSN